MLVLADLQALASNYSHTGVYLSGDSLALLLSLNQYCELYNWRGSALDNELTPTERDTIQAIVDKAYGELMADNPMIGTVVFGARGSMGNGLLCDGNEYDGADYPQLYAVIDSAFKTSGGMFVVPNLIGNFVLGTDDDGNATGGSATHTLSSSEMPSHSHVDAGHTHTEITAIAAVGAAIAGVPIPSAIPAVGVTGVGTANIQNTGGGQAHNNMPPYVKLFPFLIWR